MAQQFLGFAFRSIKRAVSLLGPLSQENANVPHPRLRIRRSLCRELHKLRSGCSGPGDTV